MPLYPTDVEVWKEDYSLIMYNTKRYECDQITGIVPVRGTRKVPLRN
jgi:hypothetical protein